MAAFTYKYLHGTFFDTTADSKSNSVKWTGAATNEMVRGQLCFAHGNIRFLSQDVPMAEDSNIYTVLAVSPYLGGVIREGDSGATVSILCHCDDSESSKKAVGMIIGCNRNSRLGYAIPYQPILNTSDLFSKNCHSCVAQFHCCPSCVELQVATLPMSLIDLRVAVDTCLQSLDPVTAKYEYA